MKKKKVRRPGIEPGPPAWQASILPLNHRRLHIPVYTFNIDLKTKDLNHMSI